MKLIEGKLGVRVGKKVAIVSTRWNHFIVDRLVEGAKDAFARHGGNDDDLTHVLAPGAFELPMVIDQLLNSGKYDAVCALGAVIRGSTPHFDYVCKGVTDGIVLLNNTMEVPTIFGILTVDNEEQASDRIGGKHGHKGEEAAITAIKMIDFSRSLHKVL